MPSPANNYEAPKPKTKRRVVWPYFALLFWIFVLVIALLSKNDIYDWWRLRNYQAPASVVSLADQDTMTPYGLKMLKINHPEVMAIGPFSKDCPNDGGEKTIVLGCYHSNEDGIYLLSVSDARLNGVMQVTAAHEMLHAAYSRLSSSERSKVDAMLLNYYNHGLKDPRIIATIAEYRKTEPGAVVNEMHSVFGTEVMNLPAPLENYYKKYFTDRQKIAGYAAQYQEEFTTRQDQVNADDAQLKSELPQINSLQFSATRDYAEITAEQKQLSQLSSSGAIAQYNSMVGQFNSLVDTYNAEADRLKDMISSYNNLVNTRNSVALTENQLYTELSGGKTSTIKSQ